MAWRSARSACFRSGPCRISARRLVLAGAVTLLLPVQWGLLMMGLTFGGFHVVYGVLMGRRHGW